MKKYIAYYRKSKDNNSKKSKAKGLSIDAQKQICHHYYGKQIVKEFIENESGGNITDRGILQQAIQYCLKHDCWLVVAKVDRLARNVEDGLYVWGTLLKKKISFCDIPMEVVDKFTLTMYYAFAERELELIKLRTSQALEQRVKRLGQWRKPNKDFGTDAMVKKAVRTIKRKAKANENNTRASGYIVSLYKQGNSFYEIAKILNKEKFKSSEGKTFSTIQVQRLYKRAA